MHKDSCNYGDYFHPGQRARVELSLECGSIFSDGAVVTAIGENSIGLRLSRDRMPEGARLHPEAPLVIRVGGSGSGFRCRGRLLHERPGQELQVALVDQVASEEQREYFRINAEIPVVLYNVTANGAEENGTAGRNQDPALLPRIVNISGAGIRTETSMAMTVGDTVYATFTVPLSEPKTIPVVAQVAHSDIFERGGKAIVSTGLKFVHIFEKDRDAIVRYVCNEEMRRLRSSRRPLYSLYEN